MSCERCYKLRVATEACDDRRVPEKLGSRDPEDHEALWDAEGLDMLSDDTAELVSRPASSFGRTDAATEHGLLLASHFSRGNS